MLQALPTKVHTDAARGGSRRAAALPSWAMTGLPFRAITFDCYGTLIDWDGGAGAVLAGWAARVGLAVATDALLGAFADRQVRHQEMIPFKPYEKGVTKKGSGLES